MKISRRGYYTNVDVLYELIKQTKHREMFLLPYTEELKSQRPVRWLNASYINMMKRHWEQYGFLKRNMNIYHSLATYKDFPTFSYDWKEKSQQQRLWLTEFKNHLLKYDLFLETDADDPLVAIEDGKILRDVLNEFTIKYTCSFSGSKGVHFIVPYEEFAHLGLEIYQEKKEREFTHFEDFLKTLPVSREKLQETFDMVLLFKSINTRLQGIYAIDTLDTSISDIKRVRKVAYSWDVKSGRIALPLTDEQLDNFSFDMVEPKNVLRTGVKRRGLLWRNEDICPLKRKLNMNLFLEALGIME